MVVTPKGKKILIDGGEPDQNILVPYLLARKIKTIDYVIVSHFDSDHSGALREVVEKLKVKKIIISRQLEESEECNQMIKIAKLKKSKLIFVEAGQVLNIEENIKIKIFWPEAKNQITENALNNNSIVAKLIYKNFQMLFTGDIEQIAEEKIVEKYGKELKSTILKVSHHGSKTSSIQEFLEVIKPKIALIGVGKNNNFGHPNEDVLKRLESINCKIYRTDECGEIVLEINKNGKIANNIHR